MKIRFTKVKLNAGGYALPGGYRYFGVNAWGSGDVYRLHISEHEEKGLVDAYFRGATRNDAKREALAWLNDYAPGDYI